jgi:hypothetical protein
MMKDCAELPHIFLRELDGYGLHDGIAHIIRVARSFPLHDFHAVFRDWLSLIGFDDDHTIKCTIFISQIGPRAKGGFDKTNKMSNNYEAIVMAF